MAFVKSVISRESELAHQAEIRWETWRKASLDKLNGTMDPYARQLLIEELQRDDMRNAARLRR